MGRLCKELSICRFGYLSEGSLFLANTRSHHMDICEGQSEDSHAELNGMTVLMLRTGQSFKLENCCVEFSI